MATTYLEQRRWFVALVVALGYAIGGACCFIVFQALPLAASGARFAVVVLFIGAPGGLSLVLNRLLPLVLVKLWPQLDSPSKAQ